MKCVENNQESRMFEENKVSIIIPVYNGEEYIGETIRHILNSTYQNLEVIIVIDGCHDGSKMICENISQTDPRVHVHYKENGGIAEARNYGVAYATGKYIAFCDQDDIVEPEMYKILVQRMELSDAEFGICSCGKLVNGTIIPLEVYDDRDLNGSSIAEEVLFPIIFNGYKVPVSMTKKNRYSNIWKSLIQREFYEKNGLNFHAYVSFEDDLLMIVRILSLARKVTTSSYMGYLWRVNMHSESHARKYIENIGKKQRLWVEDIDESVKYADIKEEQRRLIVQVTNCKMYVDAVLNLCSPMRKEKLCEIPQYFHKNIYQYEFEDSMEAIEYAEKEFPMQYILLRLLRKGHTYLSFFMGRILVLLVDKVYRNKFLMKIDSFIKER